MSRTSGQGANKLDQPVAELRFQGIELPTARKDAENINLKLGKRLQSAARKLGNDGCLSLGRSQIARQDRRVVGRVRLSIALRRLLSAEAADEDAQLGLLIRRQIWRARLRHGVLKSTKRLSRPPRLIGLGDDARRGRQKATN